MPDTLQRLNMDSTWLISMGGTRLLVDPWLTGSETDGFRWLNTQWHVQSVVPPEEVPDFDAVLITQPYDDHCHIETLRRLPAGRPIYADRRAAGKIRRKLPGAVLRVLDEGRRSRQQIGNISCYLSPSDKLYNGCVLQAEGFSMLYLPHGLDMRSKYLQHFPDRADTVLISASTYRLPFWLGGMVTKGIKNVQQIQQHFRPSRLFATHDEPKEGVGLVSRMARKYYPSESELQAAIGPQARMLANHEPVLL